MGETTEVQAEGIYQPPAWGSTVDGDETLSGPGAIAA
jgi:hypothetical protein|tara:strand:- start:245 stop:355 length:111 start_codon:yes stop_codon:yes gene_type:complete